MPDRGFELVVKRIFNGVVGAYIRGEDGSKDKNRNNDQPQHGGLVAPQLTDLVKKRMPVFRIFFRFFVFHLMFMLRNFQKFKPIPSTQYPISNIQYQISNTNPYFTLMRGLIMAYITSTHRLMTTKMVAINRVPLRMTI